MTGEVVVWVPEPCTKALLPVPWTWSQLFASEGDRLVARVRLWAWDLGIDANLVEAEDIVQEVFAEAVLMGYPGKMDSPVGWLYTVARRKLARYVPEAKKRSSADVEDGDVALERGWRSTAAVPSLDSHLVLLLVLRVMKDLSYRQRAAVLWRYFGGYSSAEIGEALGCAPGTARVHVHDGLHAMKRRLPGRFEVSAAVDCRAVLAWIVRTRWSGKPDAPQLQALEAGPGSSRLPRVRRVVRLAGAVLMRLLRNAVRVLLR